MMHHLLKRPFRSRRFKRRRLAFFASLILLLIVAPIIYLGLTHPWQIKAAPWPTTANDWLKRKQVSLVNNSGQTFEANTTYAISINTKALVDSGDLLSSCADLRVYYQPNDTTNSKLAYYFDIAAGATNCADSEATKVYFPLQANLSNNATTTGYYLYYDNVDATTEASVDAFDVGAKQALMVCPLNGDTECINGDGAESPTTATGAIRYSGGKSALSFDTNDGIAEPSDIGFSGGPYTIEWWENRSLWNDSVYGSKPIIGIQDQYLQHGISIDFDWMGNVNLWHQQSGSSVTANWSTSKLTNQWVHYAIEYNGVDTAKLYINGVSQGDKSIIPADSFGGANNYFMPLGNQSTGKAIGNCVVDEFRISNTARYASNFTPQTTPFVRDDNTKLLLHFDENGDDPRNTGKAIDDSGNGNHGTITGAKYVAGLVGVDAASTDTGKAPSQSYASHNGVFIEEGTTNKITNPSFDHTTYDTNWTAGGNITLTSNTTSPYFKFGSKSSKLVAAADETYVTSINPGNTNTHTLSAYVYDGTTGNVGGTVSAAVAKLVFNGSVVTPSAYTDMGGGWWRLSYSAAAANSAGNYGVQVLSGKTIYVDGVQLEEKAYTTTYADGSLGTGYSWSGTANESTSARTRADTFYSATSNVQASEGSVSFWFRPQIEYTGVSYKGLFNMGGNNMLDAFYTPASNGYIRFGNNNNLFCSLNSVYPSFNKWIHVATTWTGTTRTIYCNNGSTSYVDSTAPTIGSGINVGYTSISGNDYAANANMSDFRIYNSVLSSSEVADLYYTGLGSHQIQSDYTERFTGSSSPILSWKFDEATGTTAYDSSGKNNNGVIAGPNWSDDTFASSTEGKSLQFDGSNDLVSKTFASDEELNPSSQPFTVSAWFKSPSSGGSQHTIISRYNGSGYKVYLNSSGYICFGIDDDSTWGPDDSACSTTSFADSNWHLVTAVREATAITVYIDGVKVSTNASLTATGHLSGSNPTFYVGIDSNGTSNPWTGFIDEVRVYSYAQNTTQILADVSARGSVKGVNSAFTGEGAEGALGQGLVGYWKMDEASWNGTAGEVIDSSGNTNHGVRSGNATTGTGKFGNGGSFDGDTDYVSVTSHASLNPSSQVTISGWIKYSNIADEQYYSLVRKGGIYQLYVPGSSNAFAFYVYGANNDCTSTNAYSSLVVGNWYHITGVYDGKNKIIYVNGSQIANTACDAGVLDSSAQALTIGYANTDYDVNGSLDDVRVYNRALSPAEVQALYNWSPGPVIQYKFDEGQGQTINDSSGNGNSTFLGETSGQESSDPSWTQGKYGKGLLFDGDDYVLKTSSSAPTGQKPWSISLWIKPQDPQQGRGYTSSSIQWGSTSGSNTLTQIGHTYIAPETRIKWSTYGSSLDILTYNGQDYWNHIAVTYDGTTVKTYYDGVLGTSGNYTMAIDNSNLLIGGVPAGFLYKGSIDDVKIYNYTRTSQQIVEDMNAGHPTPGSPVGSALVYLKLDEGYGETLHNSGSGGDLYAGDLGGFWISCPNSACPAWSNSGKFDHALSFDGGDFAQLNPDLNLTGWTNLSISGWFYSNTSSSTRVIISKFDEGDQGYGSSVFKIWLDGSDNLIFKLSTNGPGWPHTITGPPVTENTWHHFVADWDGSTQKLYLDGSLVGETTATGTLTNPQTITLGRESYTTSGYFNGLLDEMKIYNSVLTSDQIKTEYNMGKATVLGALSTDATGLASNASDRTYCPPGNIEGNCAPGQNPAPIARWDLDELSGERKDTSTSGYNLSDNNTVGGDAGKIGNAAKFVSTNNEYFHNNAAVWDTVFTESASWSIGGWFYKNVNANQGIISHFNSSSFKGVIVRDGTGTFVFQWLDTTTASRSISLTSIPINSWNYFEVGYDMVTDKMFASINGARYTTLDVSPYTFAQLSGIPLHLGSSRGTSNYFDGKIDNVKIYNYARTPAQIAWDYNRGKPVAHWKLDECTGTSIHSSNESYNSALNGTWTGSGGGTQTSVGDCSTGGTAWGNGASGKYNGSLNFDGTDDRVTIPSNTNLNLFNELSFGGWIKTSFAESVAQTILSKGNFALSGTSSKFALVVSNSGNVGAFYRNLSTSIGYARNLRDGNWHHVLSTISASANSWKLFIDGKQVYSTTFTAAASADTTGDLDIGTLVYDTEPGSLMNGQIDDVQIFNYALTNQQVQTVFNSGSVRYE